MFKSCFLPDSMQGRFLVNSVVNFNSIKEVLMNVQPYFSSLILFWAIVIVFPLYFINALTLGSAFFIFWCQFLCIDIFMCYLFKMCVLKTNRSVKNIPGLEPHYHKILICRQTRNDTMEKNHWVQPDNLFWKVPFCFFSFGGK